MSSHVCYTCDGLGIVLNTDIESPDEVHVCTSCNGSGLPFRIPKTIAQDEWGNPAHLRLDTASLF